MLMHLFVDDPARKKVRDIVFDAFGVYFTIEQLSPNLRIRLSATEPDESEQSWNEAARQFHGRALHIKEASDGVQAFVGILCAVLSGDYRAILIDEPEAFLHPPLARKLGYQLTTNLKPGGTLMASTHSPDFLMGCLQASPNVRVVRLEYSKGKSRGKIVDPAVLTRLFKAPLLRSANVISALFHDGVVVTESDNDRAFYSEIYYRISEEVPGTPSILFINAQNKQTIRDIVGPLRTFGVPAAAISDIDILKDGGNTWTGWLGASQVPEPFILD
jgi:AAA domain, putative AbiEii toxin, Type IV TA system